MIRKLFKLKIKDMTGHICTDQFIDKMIDEDETHDAGSEHSSLKTKSNIPPGN